MATCMETAAKDEEMKDVNPSKGEEEEGGTGEFSPTFAEIGKLTMEAWEEWGKKALCLPVYDLVSLKVYVLNPSDCLVFHVCNFVYEEHGLDKCSGREMGCVALDSKIYVLGGDLVDWDDINRVPIYPKDVYIWDVLRGLQLQDAGGEDYGWEKGPSLNGGKPTPNVFVLAGKIFALSLGIEERFRSELKVEHPFEFLDLKEQCWHNTLAMPPAPLLDHHRVCLEVVGFTCVGDYKLVMQIHVHPVTGWSYEPFFFCYDVHGDKWTKISMDGSSLTLFSPGFGIQPRPRYFYGHSCHRYQALVSDYALFVCVPSDDFSFHKAFIYDFTGVPDQSINDDECIGKKDLHLLAEHELVVAKDSSWAQMFSFVCSSLVTTWGVIHLGGMKFCLLAFFPGNENYVLLCIYELAIKDCITEEHDEASSPSSEPKNKKRKPNKCVFTATVLELKYTLFNHGRVMHSLACSYMHNSPASSLSSSSGFPLER